MVGLRLGMRGVRRRVTMTAPFLARAADLGPTRTVVLRLQKAAGPAHARAPASCLVRVAAQDPDKTVGLRLAMTGVLRPARMASLCSARRSPMRILWYTARMAGPLGGR
jgi:hypothetical protein